MRAATVGFLLWWLFYFPEAQEGWRPFRSFTEQARCETAAANFRAAGIQAVCIEIKSF